MSAPERAPLSLRVAMRTWARRDRRACGEVVVATAQDLVDDGASPRREALGIVRTGVVLRGRGLVRDLRAARWAQASRLFAAACALLAAGLISAARGGPEGLLSDALFLVGLRDRGFGTVVVSPSPADASGLLLLLALLLVALAAATRRRALALAGLLVAGGMLAIMHARGYAPRPAGFEYQLRESGSGANYDPADWLVASIDTSGVIGWLVAAAALALAGTLLTRRAGRGGRGSSTASASERRPDAVARSSRRPMVTFAALAFTAVVILPLLAVVPDLTLSRLSVGVGEVYSGGIEATPIWTILVATAGSLAVAAGARRRAPVVAHAAALLTLVLWVPLIWLDSNLIRTLAIDWPLERYVGETAAVLVGWVVSAIPGIVLATTLIASTGRRVGRGGPGPRPSAPPLAAS